MHDLFKKQFNKLVVFLPTRVYVIFIGVNMLIEFLEAAGNCADNLNFIGAEGLGKRIQINQML